MSLKVYKGDEASRDYENDFFREFASNLVELFDSENLDGILVGHPKVPANKYLKPDCVLITENRLVIIDFKNHDGKIWLPDEASFEDTPWRHDGTIVEGGTSINPFEQLKKQKEWIEEMIGEDVYGRTGIACIVCFQGDMNVMNQVPGKYQAWFSVTNRNQYLNRIRDAIGVNLHKHADIEAVHAYFEAKPYRDYFPVNLEDYYTVCDANARCEMAEQRAYDAEQDVKRIKAELRAAKAKEKETEELKRSLEIAEERAEKATKKAQKELNYFDHMRHELDLATQHAIEAQARAEKAKADEKRAEIEASTHKEKIKAEAEKAAREAELHEKKDRQLFIVKIVVAIVVLCAIGAGIFFFAQNNENNRQKEAEEKAQLEKDYENGVKCITPDMAEKFVGKNVCVDYYVGYVNSNSYYIYLDEKKEGDFQVIITKKSKILSVNEAKEKYLNKNISVRGTLEKYKDAYEIKVTNLDQITLK